MQYASDDRCELVAEFVRKKIRWVAHAIDERSGVERRMERWPSFEDADPKEVRGDASGSAAMSRWQCHSDAMIQSVKPLSDEV
jgi:hypothetical protein